MAPAKKIRKALTAYQFFVQHIREDIKKKHVGNEPMLSKDILSEAGRRWQELSDQMKRTFENMAGQDKMRYETELKSQEEEEEEEGVDVDENVVSEPKRKKKEKKDPNAPKRPMTSFFLFCADERSKVKSANPDLKVGQIAKLLGEMWAAIDPKQKTRYEETSKRDRARYNAEKERYDLMKASVLK